MLNRMAIPHPFPYQGTSCTRDHRYCSGLSYAEFADALQAMNDRGLSYMASYDGKTGEKSHGKPLPRSLSLEHLYIRAGRSSQATLLGDKRETVESLYLSPALVERLNDGRRRDWTFNAKATRNPPSRTGTGACPPYVVLAFR